MLFIFTINHRGEQASLCVLVSVGAYFRCGGSPEPAPAAGDEAPWAAARAGLPGPDRSLSARPLFCSSPLSLLLSGPGSRGACWACRTHAQRLRGGCAAPCLSPGLVRTGGGPCRRCPVGQTEETSTLDGAPQRHRAVTWGAAGRARSIVGAPGVLGAPWLRDAQ